MSMMMNLRRRYGGKKLPYDAEIEYLESSGTQYIDTGIYLGIDGYYALRRNIDISFMFTKDISNNSIILGTYSTKKGTPRNQFYINSSKFYAQAFKIIDGITIGDIISLNTKYNVKLYNTNTYNQTLLSLALFALNGDTAGVTRFINGMRLYSCKIVDTNNEILIDFIPVRVGQVGYMYDKVSRRLFGNSGTGNFIIGNDV